MRLKKIITASLSQSIRSSLKNLLFLILFSIFTYIIITQYFTTCNIKTVFNNFTSQNFQSAHNGQGESGNQEIQNNKTHRNDRNSPTKKMILDGENHHTFLIYKDSYQMALIFNKGIQDVKDTNFYNRSVYGAIGRFLHIFLGKADHNFILIGTILGATGVILHIIAYCSLIEANHWIKLLAEKQVSLANFSAFVLIYLIGLIFLISNPTLIFLSNSIVNDILASGLLWIGLSAVMKFPRDYSFSNDVPGSKLKDILDKASEAIGYIFIAGAVAIRQEYAIVSL